MLSLALAGSLMALAPDALRIEPSATPGSTHELIVPTNDGDYYSLRQSSNLVDWSVVAGYPIQSNGSEHRHGFTVTTQPQFYVVKEVQVSDTVSWTIGKSNSSIDGGASQGPVTFTWRFNFPVEHGVYLDGTPWVVWQPGLMLIGVTPSQSTLDLPDYGSVRQDAITDATVINLGENILAMDERMGDTSGNGPWGQGADVWNGSPSLLTVGDCIATGRGRRDDRGRSRRMVFTAIGVCNVVAQDMTGRYRPPIRMPANQRATLQTPQQVDVRRLPSFALANPRDWSGASVNFDLSTAVAGNADDLLNGPMGNCGVYSHVWYETANGMLNHNLSGTDDNGYQRDVADRFAVCLYTAFDPDEPLDKRQRSLNKFIQGGLDYYYQHSLGYAIGNGGGGHCNGVEGIITLTGALVRDAAMTDAIKYQRFLGSAVGNPSEVIDMYNGTGGAFSRSEATHLVSPATWQSDDYYRRPVGNGASDLAESMVRIDFARDDLVLNNADVPYTQLQNSGNLTVVTISGSYAWPMFTENKGTEARRSYRFLPGAVMRLIGDAQVRKILAFERTAASGWSETTWQNAGGKGGVIFIYPALTSAELAEFGPGGTLTTGVSTRAEAEAGVVNLWESWPADSETRVLQSFFTSPIQDYLGIKLADHFHWLPYYHLLEDPGAPGKKLYEESPTYAQTKTFVQMQRNFGQYFWDQFTSDSNMPDTPEVQALVRHYLLDDQMASEFCIQYGPAEAMWTD